MPLRTLTPAAIGTELTRAGFDAGAVRYPVRTYQLVYRTVDPRGRPATASGLLALPDGDGARQLRTVSFAHGTESDRDDAPSVSQPPLTTDGWAQAPALTYASAGFAAVAPDYLGLGVGPGLHPWMDVPSETTASLDMLRAARAFTPSAGRRLGRDVLLTGFSQGASAALGLGRALQGGADRHFRLAALAPISGAYNWRHAELPALLREDGTLNAKAAVVYTTYLLVAWNRLHHLYGSPSEVFRSPYDETVTGLFDGTHRGPDLFDGTPDAIGGLLTGPGRAMLEHPTGRLAAALAVVDGVCVDWTPRVPVRMYWAGGDREAAPANTAHCAADLRAHGVHPTVVNVGDDASHVDSNPRGTAGAVRWFLSLR